MNEKVEIKKVVLKLGDKEVSLSIEEAKKLKELLSELFGKDVVKEVRIEHHEHYRPNWYWDWQRPYYSTIGTQLYKSADTTIMDDLLSKSKASFTANTLCLNLKEAE